MFAARVLKKVEIIQLSYRKTFCPSTALPAEGSLSFPSNQFSSITIPILAEQLTESSISKQQFSFLNHQFSLRKAMDLIDRKCKLNYIIPQRFVGTAVPPWLAKRNTSYSLSVTLNCNFWPSIFLCKNKSILTKNIPNHFNAKKKYFRRTGFEIATC